MPKHPVLYALQEIIKGEDLSQKECYLAMESILKGQSSEKLIAAFLTAMRMKGEKSNEVTGFVMSMRHHMLKIKAKAKWVVDNCGTGGDMANTLNISTISGIVAASGGVCLAKHGNRSVSSHCGSADVLEALGANINLNPVSAKKILDQIGFVFLFAPLFNPAMKNVLGVRRELKFRTVFNILGPLLNPCSPQAQMIGIFDFKLSPIMAKTLKDTGTQHAFIVSSSDGLDEISLSHQTRITELKNGEIKNYQIDPEKFHLHRGYLSQLHGGNAKTNAHIVRQVLSGKEHSYRTDTIAANAAPVLILGKKASSFKEGIQLAQELIQSKKALHKLEEYIELSNKFKK